MAETYTFLCENLPFPSWSCTCRDIQTRAVGCWAPGSSNNTCSGGVKAHLLQRCLSACAMSRASHRVLATSALELCGPLLSERHGCAPRLRRAGWAEGLGQWCDGLFTSAGLKCRWRLNTSITHHIHISIKQHHSRSVHQYITASIYQHQHMRMCIHVCMCIRERC